MLIPYTWNTPGNVSRDAKYSVRNGKVGVLYRTHDDEEWTMSTDDHQDLVKMVNNIKEACNFAPGGVFYINEFRQVIVPAKEDDETNYYYAGEYHQDIVFDFEGRYVSGHAVDLEGNRLSPGDEWAGIHPGIKYVLNAGAQDISFKLEIRPNVTKKVCLSREVGSYDAKQIIARIRAIKGFEGGGFYINEHREMFAPVYQDYVKYIYIGRLGPTDPWFPKPSFR